MITPVFISREAVDYLHKSSIQDFGGSDGVRDEGLVESALAAAVNTYHYADGDLFDIAAAYAFHISESQAFLDGNKRTGLKVALSFLKVNGINTLYDPLLIYDLMMALANRRLDKAGFAVRLRQLAEAADRQPPGLFPV